MGNCKVNKIEIVNLLRARWYGKIVKKKWKENWTNWKLDNFKNQINGFKSDFYKKIFLQTEKWLKNLWSL